jgi:NAD(P)-dependent dehydrogenase (short-subunit alcohol dehydrogenase family)
VAFNSHLTHHQKHRGLGASICTKFAAQGSNIAINYAANAQAADDLAATIRKDYGVKVICLQGDAGNLVDCKFLVHETIKELGGIDVVIGNAVSLYFLLSLAFLLVKFGWKRVS